MGRFTVDAAERRWPNLRPRDAATLIIIDRSRKIPKVLMGKRHSGHKFMPGKFVFPGGRIEPGDRRVPAAGALHARFEEALAARAGRASPGRGRALAMTAIRETFEETGIVLGSSAYGSADALPQIEPWMAFRERGVLPDLEAIHFVGRAITPPGRPRRFDTRFFAIDRDHITHQAEGVVGADSELTELVWVSLPKAQELDLSSITQNMLDELEFRIQEGFAPELPVPFYYETRGRRMRELL
jgi:8-oxo-dGTP pyrophosphatase MutT (NUDIX family)